MYRSTISSTRSSKKYILEEEESDEAEDNNEIEVLNNNIYFYKEINSESTLKLQLILNKKIIEHKIISVKNDCEYIPIKLHINSPGGEVPCALSIIDTIINSEVPIHTIIEGEAASAATLISIVGHKRFITEHSHMLIHQIRGGFWGKMDECLDELNNIKQYERETKELYKHYTKLNVKDLNAILKKEL